MKLQKLVLLGVAVSQFSAPTSALGADEIVLQNEGLRAEYLKRAEVWLAPKWISKDFKFSPQLDVLNGPELKGNDKLLATDDLYCERTANDLEKSTGKTPKFDCRILTKNKNGQLQPVIEDGKRKKVKVKYDSPVVGQGGEIFAEVIGTRLLWALGFAADHVNFVQRTHCAGCPDLPFTNRYVDSSTLKNPRTFDKTAVEKKLSGVEIVFEPLPTPRGTTPGLEGKAPPPRGFLLADLMHYSSDDTPKQVEQKAHRDALRLMAVLMQHTDNKADNQRLMCLGEAGPTTLTSSSCKGRVVGMIHDTGLGFGMGVRNFKVSRAKLQDWADENIWKNPSRCIGKVGLSMDTSMMYPQISEEGRVFLARLLDGFSKGEAGRKRVEDLFKASQITQRDGTHNGWVDAFYSKVEQIKYPMGRGNPNFRCPKVLAN